MQTMVVRNMVEKPTHWFNVRRFFQVINELKRPPLGGDVFNFFEYLSDVINKAATMQPNTKIGAYRELLPDKWKKL